MAQNAVSINILSNVREAVRGVDDAADAVDEVSDRLRDLTKEGDKSTDRMERDFKDLSRTASRESDELRDKFRDAYRDIRRSSDDTADHAVRAQRRMGEQSAEVGSEIRQNLGEGIANAARGDFEALSDTIGDTLGGTVAGIGGIGTAAVAAAGAAGLGLIIGAITQAQEDAEKLRERLADAYRTAAEEGRDYLDTAQTIGEAHDIMFNPDRAEEWKRVQETQKQTGLDMNDVLRAQAGDLEAIEKVRGRLAEVIDDEIEKNFEATGRQFEYSRELQRTEDYWRNLGNTATEQSNRVQDALRFTSDLLVQDIEQAGKVQEEVDEVGNRLITLPDGKQVLIEADTGQATSNLERFKGDADGVVDHISSREAVMHIRADYSQALRDARRAAGEISRETATITINSRFGRRFGG